MIFSFQIFVVLCARCGRSMKVNYSTYHKLDRYPDEPASAADGNSGATRERARPVVADPRNLPDLTGPSRPILCHQAGVNIGTDTPPLVFLKVTLTRCPIRTESRSQSTILVSILTPSSSVT